MHFTLLDSYCKVDSQLRQPLSVLQVHGCSVDNPAENTETLLQ
jgi:hypothetical protein